MAIRVPTLVSVLIAVLVLVTILVSVSTSLHISLDGTKGETRLILTFPWLPELPEPYMNEYLLHFLCSQDRTYAVIPSYY